MRLGVIMSLAVNRITKMKVPKTGKSVEKGTKKMKPLGRFQKKPHVPDENDNSITLTSKGIKPHPFTGRKNSKGQGIGPCEECGKPYRNRAHWRIAASKDVTAGGPGSGRHKGPLYWKQQWQRVRQEEANKYKPRDKGFNHGKALLLRQEAALKGRNVEGLKKNIENKIIAHLSPMSQADRYAYLKEHGGYSALVSKEIGKEPDAQSDSFGPTNKDWHVWNKMRQDTPRMRENIQTALQKHDLGIEAATHEHFPGEFPGKPRMKKAKKPKKEYGTGWKKWSDEGKEKVRKHWQEKAALHKNSGKSVRGRPILTDKQKRAVASVVTATKEHQDKAEELERLLAKHVGGEQSENNKPFDVLVHGKKRTHGIEVKTLLLQKNDKITMKRDAIDRKNQWAKKNKATMHTVAIDMRGQKPVVYHRQGVGAFRLQHMTKVDGGFKGLKSIFV